MTNIFIDRTNNEIEYDELAELQHEDEEMEFQRNFDYNQFFKEVVIKMAEHYAILMEKFVGKHRLWREIKDQMGQQIERFGGRASQIDACWIKKHGKIMGHEIIKQQLKNNALKNPGNSRPKYQETSRIVKMKLPN